MSGYDKRLKEIKAIIHGFYIEQNAGITCGIDKLLSEENDYTVRFIMRQLEGRLAWKQKFEHLNESESILYYILSKDSFKNLLKGNRKHSKHLVDEFKIVLKELD